MEVNFCENCDNLLYIYSNEENNTLYLGCKVCGNKKDYSECKCIYSNEFNIDLSEYEPGSITVENQELSYKSFNEFFIR